MVVFKPKSFPTDLTLATFHRFSYDNSKHCALRSKSYRDRKTKFTEGLPMNKDDNFEILIELLIIFYDFCRAKKFLILLE